MSNPVDEDLIELRLRQSLDPVYNYLPQPTQKRCLYSRSRYRWLGGPNRGGKTAHVAIELSMAARMIHPTRTVRSRPVSYLVLAPRREQLQDPWGKKLLKDCELRGFAGRPMIPDWDIEDVRYTHGAGAPTIKQIDMKCGHTIRFGISGTIDAWKGRQGQSLAAILPDESESNMQMMEEWYARLLDANDDPDLVRECGGGWILWGASQTTANPGLTRFVELCDNPAPEAADWEAFRIPAEESIISVAERERLKVAFDEEGYNVRMLGTAAYADRLLIYGKQWREHRHMFATDYQVQETDNIYIAYDPGGAGKESHDSGILFAAINKENPRKINAFRYVRLNRTTLGYDVTVMATILKGRPIEALIPDPAINKTEKGTGKSLRQQLREEMIKQKIVCHRGLIHVLNRHDPGIKRVQTYLERDLIGISPSRESGCQILRGQMLAYKSNEENVYHGANGVVKIDDEGPDCMRYLVMAKPFWANRPCGRPKWDGDVIPPPPPLPEPEILTQDQENFRTQLERSIRLTTPMMRRRIRN